MLFWQKQRDSDVRAFGTDVDPLTGDRYLAVVNCDSCWSLGRSTLQQWVEAKHDSRNIVWEHVTEGAALSLTAAMGEAELAYRDAVVASHALATTPVVGHDPAGGDSQDQPIRSAAGGQDEGK